jgi:hypothetical protein
VELYLHPHSQTHIYHLLLCNLCYHIKSTNIRKRIRKYPGLLRADNYALNLLSPLKSRRGLLNVCRDFSRSVCSLMASHACQFLASLTKTIIPCIDYTPSITRYRFQQICNTQYKERNCPFLPTIIFLALSTNIEFQNVKPRHLDVFPKLVTIIRWCSCSQLSVCGCSRRDL